MSTVSLRLLSYPITKNSPGGLSRSTGGHLQTLQTIDVLGLKQSSIGLSEDSTSTSEESSEEDQLGNSHLLTSLDQARHNESPRVDRLKSANRGGRKDSPATSTGISRNKKGLGVSFDNNSESVGAYNDIGHLDEEGQESMEVRARCC